MKDSFQVGLLSFAEYRTLRCCVHRSSGRSATPKLRLPLQVEHFRSADYQSLRIMLETVRLCKQNGVKLPDSPSCSFSF